GRLLRCADSRHRAKRADKRIRLDGGDGAAGRSRATTDARWPRCEHPQRHGCGKLGTGDVSDLAPARIEHGTGQPFQIARHCTVTGCGTCRGVTPANKPAGRTPGTAAALEKTDASS